MHVDSSTYTTPDGRTDTRHLLRESYRSGGKVLKRALANLSHLEPERLEALPLALAHNGPVAFTAVPQPRDSTQPLLSAAGIDLAAARPVTRRTGPDTRRKLPPPRRPQRVREAAVDTNGSAAAKP